MLLPNQQALTGVAADIVVELICQNTVSELLLGKGRAAAAVIICPLQEIAGVGTPLIRVAGRGRHRHRAGGPAVCHIAQPAAITPASAADGAAPGGRAGRGHLDCPGAPAVDHARCCRVKIACVAHDAADFHRNLPGVDIAVDEYVGGDAAGVSAVNDIGKRSPGNAPH